MPLFRAAVGLRLGDSMTTTQAGGVRFHDSGCAVPLRSHCGGSIAGVLFHVGGSSRQFSVPRQQLSGRAPDSMVDWWWWLQQRRSSP
jgi:hypothetical protein